MPTGNEGTVVPVVPVAPVVKVADPATIPLDWDAWMGTQDENVKTLYAQHTTGLVNTVKATRQERDDLAKQIKELAKSQEAGSEARKALDAMSEKLEVTERRAAFLEDAMRPEIQCRNPRAAWLLAQAENLFDGRGHPNWDGIKSAAPEIFGAVVANANAGAGTGKPPSPSKSMNAYIRAAAGRT